MCICVSKFYAAVWLVEWLNHEIRGCTSVSHLNTPIPSMYGISTYIFHKNQPDVGEYIIHGCYGTYQLLIKRLLKKQVHQAGFDDNS